MGPLEGIRVLDFTQMMAGPLCAMLLGDLGADVIKIEPPEGDAIRRTGDTFLGGETESFLSFNRNKRSVVLDLKAEAGREAGRGLAAGADVVLENFRPGSAERLGVGYEVLRALNPRLVYCSISGFGREGADRARPALDPVIQAMSGIMQLTGSDETGPLRTGFPFSDLVTPLLATIGVLAALRVRERTGRGQRVDLSMLDATIFGMMPRDAYFFATGRTPSRLGNEHYQIAPWNTYATADGRYLMVVAHTEKFWHALITALAAPELGADPRFLSNADRVRNRTALNARLAAAFRTASLDEWTPRLTAAGVLFAPVRSFPEVFSDPRVRREMLVELDHPTAGRITVLANPLRFSETPATVRRCPPRLGEHTAEVLSPDTDEAGGAAS
ncbi:MAG: alpha-methylacyl-CoA racemase [Candidatus Rokubacteria bacterium GWC2_70_16]|nr:MAG: alpha-methylacyl-CoA racemase [Candidatus Rokubacteria bacterium GWC2_70_16]